MRILLTGGTGFLGSHVAEAAMAAGHAVRALARPGADIRHLQALGAEVAPGDLSDMQSLLAAADGCQTVIHSAAKVGDWGTWRDHFAGTVEATRRVYDAAIAMGVKRAVHVSSVAVYGHGRRKNTAIVEAQGPVPESRLPRWYFYGRAKSLAETLAMQYHAEGALAMSVIRPGWIYGPRDRAGLPRLLTMLAKGAARVIGKGSNAVSLTYAANVADAILLAAEDDRAKGEVFNVANDQLVTQRYLFDALADMLGVVRPRAVPAAAAHGASWILEKAHRWLGRAGSPAVTRQAVRLMSLDSRFSTEKIRGLLGWTPRIDFATGLERIKTWWATETSLASGERTIARGA